ncbi:hypothetical protein NUU61_001956 [Penicillium alfredii]|uniref:Gamma-glutamylcyclotransferase AIG2-like domain-containing protein n=1 Tax=Penicillium alfredii TaxID=1506179 RepID=A0A9W9KFJ1_9EURO|nr:uncharacterized protein NUU61_001956 [Penicillium alfredii]KAJ5104609.1 hypothetical protein NUU61_001956 [Penicillium alfredii]
MLRSEPPDYLTNIQEPIRELPPNYLISYFFYGTLTNSATLQRILDLHGEPKLRKADIIGYALAKWGDYPALIDGQQGQVVSGSVYVVQSEKTQKLVDYETKAYMVADCWFFFRDAGGSAEEIPGKT